jgi:hypothetical protein
MSDGTWEIPGGETVRKATQIERVLRDLIAELRGEHWRDSAGYCAVCENKTCCVSTVLNRAEARLREVQGE